MTDTEVKEYLQDLIENEDVINSVKLILNKLEESNNKAVQRYKDRLIKHFEELIGNKTLGRDCLCFLYVVSKLEKVE